MAWTDEKVAVLKVLWAGCFTASAIAVALPGMSRNAVLGKIHRLRRGGDVAVEMGDLTRALFVEGGGVFRDARALARSSSENSGSGAPFMPGEGDISHGNR